MSDDAPAPTPALLPAAPPVMVMPVTHWRDAKGTARAIFAGAAARCRWETSAHAEPTAISEVEYDRIVRSVEFDRL